MAPAYVRRGVELDVAYLVDRPGVHGDLEAAGARLFSLDGAGGRAGWAWRAERLIAALRPDLVHTTLFEADVAGRIGAGVAGVPVVSSLVNVAYGADHAATPGVRRWKVHGAKLVDARPRPGGWSGSTLTPGTSPTSWRRGSTSPGTGLR